MNTITYKELIRLVHPDINHDLDDYSGKITLIKTYYKNESMLFKFGVEWGVIEKPKKKIVKRKPLKYIHKNQRWNTSTYIPNKKNIRKDNIIRQGDKIRVKTLDIVSICVKVTPKRVYFVKPDGVKTFCSTHNAVKL